MTDSSRSSTRTLPSKSLLFGLATLAALAGLAVYHWLNPTVSVARYSPQTATVLPVPQALTEFHLRTAQAELNLAALTGHASLVYFGYTHCPDVCPATLAELASMYQKLTNPPTLYFVSVDPERDTPSNVDQYAQHFNPHFHGATGPDDQLMRLTHRLGALYSRDTDKQGRVTVDHSGALYLINAQGEFLAVFTPPFRLDLMATDLNHLLADIKP